VRNAQAGKDSPTLITSEELLGRESAEVQKPEAGRRLRSGGHRTLWRRQGCVTGDLCPHGGGVLADPARLSFHAGER